MTRSRLVLAGAVLGTTLCLGGCQRDDGTLPVLVSLPSQTVTGVAKATVLVDYSTSDARIVVENGSPACAFILPGVDGDFSDDQKGTLTIRTNGPRALRGLAAIAACRMKPTSSADTAADIEARLTARIAAAEDPAGKAVDLAARGARPRGAAPAALMSDSAIEAAQAEAVAAAASAAAAAPAAASRTSPGNAQDTPSGTPSDASTGDRQRAGGTTSAAGAAGATATGPSAAKPGAAAGGAGRMLNDPANRAGSNDPESSGAPDPAAPTSQDPDPSYDDSPSDDERAPSYTLDIGVTTPSHFGALQFDITHLGRNGGFIGRGDQIDCVPLVDALAAANYVGERLAKVGLISLQGIRTPAAILRCGFRTREPVGPASFQIEVTDASDSGEKSEAIEPPPTVVVTNVTRR